MAPGWPHIFVQTTAAIGANQELLTEYGADYWEQMDNAHHLLKDVTELVSKEVTKKDAALAACASEKAEKDAALAACAEKDAALASEKAEKDAALAEKDAALAKVRELEIAASLNGSAKPCE